VIHSDLRGRSAETNELIKRSLATVSNTMDMIACSQDAIARSRALLDGARRPIVQNRQQFVADIGEPEIGAINTESPFGNVSYIVIYKEASICHSFVPPESAKNLSNQPQCLNLKPSFASPLDLAAFWGFDKARTR
jgi:hypothetical protein